MATTTTASKRASKATTGVFTCPECGRSFTRAAALGAYRKMTHGVAGSSANAAGNRKNSTSRGRNSTTTSRRRTTSATATNRASTAMRSCAPCSPTASRRART
jgi:hypothetical protein